MKYNLNETTQRTIIHFLCYDAPFCVRWCGLLEPEFFKTESEPRYRIMEIIREFFDKKRKKPGFSFIEQELQFLPKTIQTLVEEELELIEEVEHDFTVEELDTVVEEFILNRSILSAMEQQIELVKDRDYEEISNPLNRALRNRATDDGMEFFQEAQESVIENSVVFDDRMPTLFPSLNMYSFNGWGKEEMWTVMGQEFKSQMLIHFSLAGMLHGEDGVYVSFELATEVVLHRLTCMLTGCSLKETLDRELWVLEKLKRQRAFLSGNLTILQYPMHSLSIEALRNRIATKEAQRGKPYSWVCIDYPALMVPSKTIGNVLPLTQMTGDIKRWGQEEQKRMVIASQLNREGQAANQRGRNHVAEAKGIIDNSDGVISLNMTPEEFKSGLMSIFIVKMRNGTPYKTIPLTWGQKSFRFKETDW